MIYFPQPTFERTTMDRPPPRRTRLPPSRPPAAQKIGRRPPLLPSVLTRTAVVRPGMLRIERRSCAPPPRGGGGSSLGRSSRSPPPSGGAPRPPPGGGGRASSVATLAPASQAPHGAVRLAPPRAETMGVAGWPQGVRRAHHLRLRPFFPQRGDPFETPHPPTCQRPPTCQLPAPRALE